MGLPSANSAALGFGAFIIPVDGVAAGPFGLRELLGDGVDILSLLGFPDFLREGHARAARRPDSRPIEVLGQQAKIGDLGNGSELTFGYLPLLALSLVLLSSLLLVGAVLPPGVVALTPVSPARFARYRQPLALSAIAILVPVAIVALAAALG